MARRLLIETGFGETRLALLEQGRLVEVRMEREAGAWTVGAIHLGRVTAVEPELAGAFLDIGASKPGLLPLRDGGRKGIGVGDRLLVQVVRPPIEEKGPRLTGRPSLRGRGLALRPGRSGIAFAPNLPDPEARERIAALVKPFAEPGCGWWVERQAAGFDRSGLEQEARRLLELWREIQAQAAAAVAPATLWAGDGTIERALMDWADPALEVLVNHAAAAAAVVQWAQQRLPALVPPTVKPAPALFEAEGVEEQIEAALQPEATIPGGGMLIIEPGRTLTAIDVNAGEGGSGRRPREVNLAAATEIARQLRLRAIGGLVVIDFIDLRTPGARAPVLEALAAALASDPAGCELAGGTRLGLVELTRRRQGPSLAERLTEPCGRGGSGRTPRIETVAFELMRRIATEAQSRPGAKIRVRVSTGVAAALSGPLTAERRELEERLGRAVELIADPSLARDRFDIVAE